MEVIIDGVPYVPHAAPEAPDTDWAGLPAAEKVRIIEAMGFRRTGSDHQPDCPYQWDAGLRCQCVKPPDTYGMPTDVEKHLGQDWETLKKIPSSERRIYAVERW